MPDNNYEETLHQFERRIRLGTAGPGVVSAHGCGVSRAFSTQVLELAYFSSVIHQTLNKQLLDAEGLAKETSTTRYG
jgi:hypothetical protein